MTSRARRDPATLVDPNPSGECQCGKCHLQTPIATRNIHRLGHVKGKHVPFIRGHRRLSEGRGFIVEDRGYKTPCHIWNGTKNQAGYGYLTRNGKRMSAHKFYWEKKHGLELPKGLVPDHLCKVSSCVNADHLDAVTQAVNVQRGRMAKLTMEKVREIRRRPLTETNRALAKEFGVSANIIHKARHGETWKE